MFCRFIAKYLLMNAVYEKACTCAFELLRAFWIFVMFVSKEVCEIVVIISDNTDYKFSEAIFIQLSMFSWDTCI